LGTSTKDNPQKKKKEIVERNKEEWGDGDAWHRNKQKGKCHGAGT
tara:strand:- start:469 stop:603 length:135 start_codon:yes stop_codon:yes gene_type:complete